MSLAEALRDGRPLASVPGLTYRRDGEIVATPPAGHVDVGSLPPPDFRGLELERYLSPRPILPLLTSRGCYWDRCTFCSHTWSYDGHYQHHTADRVVDDLKWLCTRHGAADFYFVDECLAPASLLRISRKLLAEGLEVRWMADVRYDKAFSREVLETARASGCQMLAFGLESINDRVTGLMRKGTRRDTTARILRDCHELGIASNVMFFIGFPSETEEEARQTLDFLLAYRERVDMVSLGTFQLNANARMHRVAKAVGLEMRQDLPPDELSDFHRYSVAKGLSELAASRLEEEFLHILQSEDYDYPLLSRTHALLVERSLYGFMPSENKTLPASAAGVAVARKFSVARRCYSISEVRRAARTVREHLRVEALTNLCEVDTALLDCRVVLEPHPAVVLSEPTMGDWAVDLNDCDAELLPEALGLSSLRDLAARQDSLNLLGRLCRLEHLGVIHLGSEVGTR